MSCSPGHPRGSRSPASSPTSPRAMSSTSRSTASGISGSAMWRRMPEKGTTDMSKNLDGLVAIVTGGASGIGAAIASRLRAGGALVAIFDVHPDDATEADAAMRVDVTDDASVVAGVAAVIARFGRIDIVVNNAGIGAQGDVAANSDEEWHRVWDINVVGMARV